MSKAGDRAPGRKQCGEVFVKAFTPFQHGFRCRKLRNRFGVASVLSRRGKGTPTMYIFRPLLSWARRFVDPFDQVTTDLPTVL